MRECPSKGFLIQNDLNADEDYCNHCMGWIIPMLEGVGAEIVEHEHNHCGQCWATMRMKDRPSQPLNSTSISATIRAGNADISTAGRTASRCRIIPRSVRRAIRAKCWKSWFHGIETVGLLGKGSGIPQNKPISPAQCLLATDAAYNDRQCCPAEPMGVLIGCPPADLAATAARYLATPPAERPLLMHAYLPASPLVDFISAGLPRPVPILPLLIRKNKYIHRPGGPYPTTEELLALLASALEKKTV